MSSGLIRKSHLWFNFNAKRTYIDIFLRLTLSASSFVVDTAMPMMLARASFETVRTAHELSRFTRA